MTCHKPFFSQWSPQLVPFLPFQPTHLDVVLPAATHDALQVQAEVVHPSFLSLDLPFL